MVPSVEGEPPWVTERTMMDCYRGIYRMIEQPDLVLIEQKKQWGRRT